MSNNLTQLYQKRVETFEKAAAALTIKYDRYAFVRLLFFLIGVAVLIYLYSNFVGVAIGATILFIWGFGRFVWWHQDLLYLKQHTTALKTINQAELERLKGNINQFDTGNTFSDSLHPYTIDLDIFGQYSFFQYMSRTSTVIGKKVLAQYLKNTTTKSVILERQEAGLELKTKLDWRQHFQAYGYHTTETERDILQLINWLDDAPIVLNNIFLRTAIVGLPVLFFVALGAIYFGLPYQIAVGIAILNLIILQQTFKAVNQTHQKTSKADEVLKNYAQLIQYIEQETFQSKQLVELQDLLKTRAIPASKSLKKLSYIIHQLNVRFNIFAVLLNAAFLWDLQWILRLEKWKHNLKTNLPQWFEALQGFDAMVSLGTLHYNHPDWALPEIDENFEGLIAKNIGHPLIAKEKRIGNDLIVPSSGHIKLITGSNMAGKSTFLRSVGINIVLAMMGAPVCADYLKLPILQVHTSMRTQDALHESTSSFYAELKRLKTIIEAVETQHNVFFLLDEILKGTNSNDRHTGSKALIQQLIKGKGMGLIATHDLELGALEATANEAIENLCLEVQVEGDQLIFDYKVKKGVSQSFNATHLMRNMGIKI